MTEFEIQKIELESKLNNTTDFFEKMDIEDQLYDLKIKYGLVQVCVLDKEEGCESCGS